MPWRGGQVILGIISVTVVFLLLAWLVVSKIGIDQPSLVLLLTSLILGLAILGAVALIGLRPYRVSLGAFNDVSDSAQVDDMVRQVMDKFGHIDILVNNAGSLIGLRPYRVSLITLGITPLGAPRVKVAVMTLVVLGLSLGATGLYAALVQWFGIERLQPPEIPPGIVLPGAGAALTFIALVLWTPFTEEVFFRGFVFTGLWPRLGSTGAIIVSALIFSLFHPALGVLIPIFITGVLLAWLYRRTGSLWPSIVAHAGQNAIALTVTMLGL